MDPRFPSPNSRRFPRSPGGGNDGAGFTTEEERLPSHHVNQRRVNAGDGYAFFPLLQTPLNLFA